MASELSDPHSSYAVSPTRLLLDTHVFLWSVSQPAKLSEAVLGTIRAAAKDRRLLVSVMTVWEVALLVSKGRISLPSPTRQWIETTFARPGLELCPLTAAVAIEASELPAGLPGDPVDRLLVATARLERLTLMTRDSLILAYARQGHVKALAA